MLRQHPLTENVKKPIQFNFEQYFPCGIYSIDCPEFLETVNEVSEEYLNKSHNHHQVNDVYPAMMSENYSNDQRLKEFCEFIGVSSWNILNDQGYAMDNFAVAFDAMWSQEHHRQSSMEQHVHGQGSQLVGFYFLEVPSGSSRVVFHDPRPGKIMVDLPQKNMSDVTLASQMVNFEPKPGRMIITNSWLPHSFTRNSSYKPLKFVHFNISLVYNNQSENSCEVHNKTEVI